MTVAGAEGKFYHVFTVYGMSDSFKWNVVSKSTYVLREIDPFKLIITGSISKSLRVRTQRKEAKLKQLTVVTHELNINRIKMALQMIQMLHSTFLALILGFCLCVYLVYCVVHD